MIELRDVRYAWPGAPTDCLAIDTLSVAAGRTLFLHGPSGGGKSTLLGLLAGVLLPRSGSVSLLGTRWSDLSGARCSCTARAAAARARCSACWPACCCRAVAR